MAIFGNKSKKKDSKVGDVLDIENEKDANHILDSFTPNTEKTTPQKQQKNALDNEGLSLSSDDENYKAFEKVRGAGSTTINIDIRMKDEHYFLMNCHLIKGIEFNKNTAFTILYDQDTFIFTGRNLLQIKPFLQVQKVLHLQEFDTVKHISPVPKNEAVITSIKWIRIDDLINEALE